MKKDAERIAAHAKSQVNDFAAETSGNEPYLFVMHKNPETGMCLFLKNNRCTIYEQRPLICRFYPFELTTDKNGTFVFTETNECPSMNSSESKKAKKLDARFFVELLKLACAELNQIQS